MTKKMTLKSKLQIPVQREVAYEKDYFQQQILTIEEYLP